MQVKRQARHAEVKPSKFKTQPCQFFERGEECPFGSRCTFAHGSHELQTEEVNVHLLRSTGLQRLDGVEAKTLIIQHFSEAVLRSTPAKVSHLGHQTEVRSSPYDNEACGSPMHHHCQRTQKEASATAALTQPVAAAHSGENAECPSGAKNCRCGIRSSCRRGARVTYSHNPYDMTGMIFR